MKAKTTGQHLAALRTIWCMPGRSARTCLVVYGIDLTQAAVLYQQALGDVALLPFGYRVHEWTKVTNHATARVIVRITGQVQGVKYRATAQRQAQQRGLRGWARNEPDGAVLIDVEGEPTVIDAFLGWCAEGPPQASVATVETTRADPVGYQEFTILPPQRW